MIKQTLDYNIITHLFRYENGDLIRISSGKIASTVNAQGYRVCSIKGRQYRVHRIIYAIYNYLPIELEVDHINRDRLDNRIENLRAVTLKQNAYNQKGLGYSVCSKTGKFKASIKKDGANIHLGVHKTIREARMAYLKGKVKYHHIDAETKYRLEQELKGLMNEQEGLSKRDS